VFNAIHGCATRQVMKAHGVYDPAKVMGVTALDVLRANTFVAEAAGAPPRTPTPFHGGQACAHLATLPTAYHVTITTRSTTTNWTLGLAL